MSANVPEDETSAHALPFYQGGQPCQVVSVHPPVTDIDKLYVDHLGMCDPSLYQQIFEGGVFEGSRMGSCSVRQLLVFGHEQNFL